MKKIILLLPIFVIIALSFVTPVNSTKLYTGPTPLPDTNEREFDGAGIYQFYGAIADPEYGAWVKGAEYLSWWCEVENSLGSYDFSGIDNSINNAISREISASLKIEALSYTEPDCPAGTSCYAGTSCNGTDRVDGNLMPGNLLDAADLNTYYVVCPLDNATYGYHRLPKYWNVSYKTAYKNMITALADHLKANPTLMAQVSQIDIATGNYGEMDPSRNTDEQCLMSKGLTEAAWNSYVNEIILHFTTQFAGTGIIPVLQGTNFYSNVDSRYDRNMYAASLGAGMYHSRLHADQDSVYATYETGQWDHIQDANNSVPYGIEYPDPNMNYGGNLNEAEGDYWSFVFALQDKSDYFRARTFPRGDLKRLSYDNPYVLSMIYEYNILAGKTALTAPYAKAWMRETASTYYPACGNFDYYMYASSAIPPTTSTCQPQTLSTVDGNAVALFSLDAANQSKCTPGSSVYDSDCDPRFKYARRTATGNPYIYLDVDSRYSNGNRQGVIKVVYLDSGTDIIQLQYKDSAGVTQTVNKTKTNTRTWRDWIIDVPDIALNNSFVSGSTSWDFRLYDNADGFDTIHSVQFTDTESVVSNTSTPTPTSVSTPTPTATGPWSLKFDGGNSYWVDTYINGLSPTTNYENANLEVNATTATPPANTGPFATAYRNIRKTILIQASYELPLGTTIVSADLCVQVSEVSTTAPKLWISNNGYSWVESHATWLRRSNTYAWPTPGAHGTLIGGTTGPWIVPNAIGEWCVPVTSFVGQDAMDIIIEPSCTNLTSCNETIKFFSSENLEPRNRPYLNIRASGTAPTATFTATSTPTPPPTSTPTPTPTRTPTRTPTSTVTPTSTRTPTAPPGASTNTPTPTGTTTPTPTRTPTGIPPNSDTPTPVYVLCPGCSVSISEICLNPTQDLNGNGIVTNGDRAIEITNFESVSSIDLSGWKLCSVNCVNLEGVVTPGSSKVFYQIPDGLIIDGNVAIINYSVTPWVIIDSVNFSANSPGLCWVKRNSTWSEQAPGLGELQ